MPSRLGSVRALTTLVATAVVAVVLVAAVAGLALAVEQALTERIRGQAQAQVDQVVQRLAAGDSPEEALQSTRRAAAPAQATVPTQVEILDHEGHPVVGSGFFTMPGVEGVTTTGAPWEDPVVKVGSVDLAVAQRSIEIGGRLLLVVAASPLAEVVHSVNAIIRLSMLGIPLITMLVGLVTWTATGQTLRPIERLRTEVEDVSSQTLDRRVEVPGTDDEVARLAHTMNGLLERLEDASARQREFVSDAAHELRSPVAAIRTELEVTLAHPSSSGWRDVAIGVLSETGRIERLVADLLLLARLDEGAGQMDERVDIGLAVRDAAGHVVAGHVQVDLDVASGLLVRGRADDIASVMRNLLDNAARHASGHVGVSARQDDGSVIVRVDDDGPGIPPADRRRVFERFARLQHARSRADGGVGLGLAVVDRVVRHHGGSVVVTDSPFGGARFEVTMPAG
ncbi:MAG TPA: HAMP domain-containing sensor histidine kinase [Euzebya sp.]|nr:HAMP domain-containing sensor histidine kinase [Euzebya sp.]